MDWKEGLKYGAVIIGATVASSLIVFFIENRLKGTVAATAKAEARAEVQRTLSEAVAQASAQNQQLRNSRVTTNPIVTTYSPSFTPKVAVDPRQQGFPINI